jgi:hypothetical protein
VKKYLFLIMIGVLIFILSACTNPSHFNTHLFNVVASNNDKTYLIEFNSDSATLIQSVDMDYRQYPLAIYNGQLVTVTKYTNYWTYAGYSITKENFMQKRWSFDMMDYSYKNFVGFNGDELAFISTADDEFYVYSMNGSLSDKVPVKARRFYRGFTDSNGKFYAFYDLWDDEDSEYYDYIFEYDPTVNSTSIVKLPEYGEVYDPKIIGDYLYFGMNEGLFFLNTQNATNVYHIITAGICSALNGFKNILYANDTQKGVDLIDISTPTQAYIQKTFPNMRLDSGFLMYKNYMVTFLGDKLYLYDISDPTTPTERYTTEDSHLYIWIKPMMSIQE